MMKAVRDEGVGERRVLVVDDEYSIVDAVATALRYEGFTVTTAASGVPRWPRCRRVLSS